VGLLGSKINGIGGSRQLGFEVNASCIPAIANLLGEGKASDAPRGLSAEQLGQMVDSLRFERYTTKLGSPKSKVRTNPVVRGVYYFLRPMLPVFVRKHLQRAYLRGWETVPFPSWPVDTTVEAVFECLLKWELEELGRDRIPFIWFWPDGARSCAIMTHDVETTKGLRFCEKLMDLNDSFRIKSSFQVVPEKRYKVPDLLLKEIRDRGFEVNVHDLNHDGLLFSDYEEFLRRAEKINKYKLKFQAEGFRSAVLYRNVDWYHALDFAYDMSIPNVAHLDPQRGGCCTVFPFFIGRTVELPVTTTQDYPLFHILRDYSIDLWKRQTEIIQAKHGLMSFIIHPDYIRNDKARGVYRDLLSHLSELRESRKTWIAIPKEVSSWWRQRSEMALVPEGDGWRIEGRGSERARVAYAIAHENKISYEIE
jgi:hypothetical protein